MRNFHRAFVFEDSVSIFFFKSLTRYKNANMLNVQHPEKKTSMHVENSSPFNESAIVVCNFYKVVMKHPKIIVVPPSVTSCPSLVVFHLDCFQRKSRWLQ